MLAEPQRRAVAFDAQDPFVRPLIEGALRVSLDHLDESVGEEPGARVSGLAAQLHDFGGEMARTLTEHVPEVRRLPIACAPGCSYCCRGTPVLVQAAEALALALHVQTARTAEQLAELTARVADTLARTRDLGVDARAEAKEPCPLLDLASGACTAYEARPTACRAYNSCDAQRCAEAHEAGLASPVLPSNPVLFRATHAAGVGLMVASEVRGLQSGPFELVSALHAALADPEASARWLRGERVFSHTKLSDEGAIAFQDLVTGLAQDFRGGRLRDAQKLVVRVDPEARRRERNRRKALGKTGKKK